MRLLARIAICWPITGHIFPEPESSLLGIALRQRRDSRCVICGKHYMEVNG